MGMSDLLGTENVMVEYAEYVFAVDPEYRKRLREPFPKEQIGKLPATQKRPALDFVGHAAVTDRLNNVAPDWNYTIDEQFSNDGTFWVRGTMTIGGITRVEYGDGDDPKDAIGNFIRRAAMRFGVAIDLWSRQELSGPVEPAARGHRADGMAGNATLAEGEGASVEGAGGPSGPPAPEPRALSSQIRTLVRLAEELRWTDDDIDNALHEAFPDVEKLKDLTQSEARQLIPTWEAASRAIRFSPEQEAIVRTLAALSDAKHLAEQLFGRKVPNLHTLTVAEGEQLIAKLREIRVVS